MAMMHRLVIILLLLGAETVAGRLGNDADRQYTERFLSGLSEDDYGNVDVIIGLKDAEDEEKLLLSVSGVELKHLSGETGRKRVNAAKANLSKRDIKQLLQRDDIAYIEEDTPIYLDSSQETIPYGISMTQGYQSGTKSHRSFADMTAGACNDPLSRKIAVIDSGALASHPDLPCRDITEEDTNCIGKEFGIEDELWYAPANPHGTHVFGTISAIRNNERGIAGMVSESNVCYLFAMIFGSDGGSKTSALIEAVEWAVNKQATVINLSLGSPIYSVTAETFFAQVRNEGVLVISASGNAGTTDLHYPASYSSVISVASVDARLQRSIFSQYNENVDIAAPGSTILSTVPLSKTNALTLYGKNNRTYDGAVMIGSVIPQEGLEGSLVVCDNYGLDECDGPGGHVCLIERGWASFETKAKSCEDSGGVAAVIYNNIPKSILYSVLSLNNTETTIPVIGISAESAVILRNDTYISFQMKDGYAYADGTSMATPHVTGAVTELWRHCPLCSSFDVETCLLTTTLPLEDNEFSYGFLQTRSAFSCLLDNGCCDEDKLYQYSIAPTKSPTSIPAYSPSSPPQS